MAYVGFLTSRAGQSVIDGYTANGQQLFFPNALSEEPNLAQYVPEGYTPAEAAALSARDRRFLRWVETEVPADY
jgi:tungstate transport system substrate-binding protein